MLEKYQNRNSSVEFLRIFFMSMIVMTHAFGHGSGLNYNYIYSLANNWQTAHHLGLFSIGKVGVTGFMFISGYYGIKLKWTKLFRLVAMLAFYLVLLLVLANQSIIASWRELVHPWDNWWFISSYLVIVLLSPFINIGIELLDKKTFKNVVIALVFYVYIGQALCLSNSHDTVYLLTVFLVARYVKKYFTPPIVNRKAVYGITCELVAIISVLMLFGCPIIFEKIGFGKINAFFISNNNLLILLFAASLVVIVEGKKWKNKMINYFASSTLAVYIITDNFFVRKSLDVWLLNEIMTHWFGYIYILLIVVGCIVVDKLREFLFYLLNVLIINTLLIN